MSSLLRTAAGAFALAVVMTTSLASTAVAADTVTPANGGYSWNTTYEESGGLREGVTFRVKGSTATIATLRGICVDDLGVMSTPTGKDAKVSVAGGKLKKVTQVDGDGDVATLTVKVVWASAKKAKGWIKVTGSYFGNECVGDKTNFSLSYVN